MRIFFNLNPIVFLRTIQVCKFNVKHLTLIYFLITYLMQNKHYITIRNEIDQVPPRYVIHKVADIS
jgi:hypothetical protein